MKKKIICILIFFITIFSIVFLRLYINNHNISKTNEHSIDLLPENRLINNSPQKIKITILNISEDENIISFISDELQIKEYEIFFNNLSLNRVSLLDSFEAIYSFIFLGQPNVHISVSNNRLLRITDDYTDNIEYYEISKSDFNKIVNLSSAKYYLHNSKLNVPSSSTCIMAQKKILNEMTMDNINLLKEIIHNTHSSLEFHLVDRTKILKNANSIYWEPETKNEIFADPNGVQIQSYGFWEYKIKLEDIVNNLNINNNLKEILQEIIFKLNKGMSEHDLSECFEAHKILHDLDYWIINYPIHDFSARPVDWSGIQCYYGTIEKFELN